MAAVERIDLCVRVAGEKAKESDEFITLSQLVNGTNITRASNGDILIDFGAEDGYKTFVITGDGIETDFNVNHAFDTWDVAHEMYFVSSKRTFVGDFQRTDTDNATVSTAPYVLGIGEQIVCIVWNNFITTSGTQTLSLVGSVLAISGGNDVTFTATNIDVDSSGFTGNLSTDIVTVQDALAEIDSLPLSDVTLPIDAIDILVDGASFSGNLSTSITNLEAALEEIDALSLGGLPTGTVLGSILANNASNEFVETDKLIIDEANSKILVNYRIVTVPLFPTNIKIGDVVLTALTTGTDNIAFGDYSLRYLTSGTRNIALGKQASEHNTIGSDCIAIGYGALQYFAYGKNIAIGYRAMQGQYEQSYGHNNIAIGEYSLSSITSGASNIAIGITAFQNRTTGQRGVAIGYGAGHSDNANDKLHIANTNIKSLIEGDFANDWVKIKDWLYVLGLTSNTLIKADTDKKLVSITNGSGYLKNDGAGNFTYETPSAGVTQLSDLSDVNLGALASGESLVWDGTKWVNLEIDGMPSGTILGSILANNASNEFVETDKLIIDIANSLIKAYYPIITVPLYPNNIKLGNAKTLQSLAAGATFNIGIGEDAGQLITTGDGNILLGYKSGNKITTGSLNVILGYSFGGTELVTGKENIFIGNTAGATSKGSYNIYMGTYSGGGALSTANGNNNIGIGSYALQRNVASSNIAIGPEAFRNRTTGYRGVAIGSYAGNNDNNNYKLHIGEIDGKSLIEGDFSNDWVKIGGTLSATSLTANTLLQANASKEIVSVPNGLITYRAKVTLTPAQLRALHTTPVEVVAAQGAGKLIVPVKIIWVYDFAVEAYTHTEEYPPVIRLGYQGDEAYSSFSGGFSPVDYSSSNAGTYSADYAQTSPNSISNLTNKAVQTNIEGGALTNDDAEGTLTVIVYYTIEDFS